MIPRVMKAMASMTARRSRRIGGESEDDDDDYSSGSDGEEVDEMTVWKDSCVLFTMATTTRNSTTHLVSIEKSSVHSGVVAR
jgi:hypothetical protein